MIELSSNEILKIKNDLHNLQDFTLKNVSALLDQYFTGSHRWPCESFSGEQMDNKLKVDFSHASDGYFLAAIGTKTVHKMKLRVTKDDNLLNYDLNRHGDYEVIPFQMGSGMYVITLWENIYSNKYASAGRFIVNVQLTNENAAFLMPNQYVNYNESTEAVAKANELCAGKTTAEAYAAIKSFISEQFRYDYVKACTVKKGILPDIDTCFTKKSGICQDLAALTVCMLRTQGIVSKLVIGTADNNYHAWVLLELNGKTHLFDPTAAVNHKKSTAKYIAERYY